MKNNIKKFIVGMIAVFGFVFIAPNAFASVTELKINPSPALTQNSATFSVYYNVEMGDVITSVVVRYGVDSSMSEMTASQTPTQTSGILSFTANNLKADKIYYFQAMGVSSSQSLITSRYTFEIKSPVYVAPDIKTLPIDQSLVTATSAVITGYYDDKGSSLTNLYFDYGTSTSSASSYPVSFSGKSGTVKMTLTGLSPNTKYWYRLGGINAGGTSHGSWYSFTTSAGTPPPTYNCTINSFNANPSVITVGSAVSFTWSSSNCSSFTINGVNASQGYTDYPSATKYYTLVGTGSNGSTDSMQRIVTVNNTPNPTYNCTINSFTPSQSVVTAGALVSFTWSSSNCNSFRINGVNASQGYTDYPSATKYYTLVGTGSNGSTDSMQRLVTVNGSNPPNPKYYCQINYFNASPNNIIAGNSVTLSWRTSNCNYLTLGAVGGGSLGLNSSMTVYPQTTTTYTLSAYGNNGNDYLSQVITVNNYNPRPNPQLNVPGATTSFVSSLGDTSAVLNGTIYTNGTSPTYAYYEYGTRSTLGWTTEKYPIYSASSSFKKSLKNLAPETTYYFRLVAENGNGISRGDILYFTTAPAGSYVAKPVIGTFSKGSSSGSDNLNNSNNGSDNSGSRNSLGAAVGTTSGTFLPGTALGWLLMAIFIFVVILIARYLFRRDEHQHYAR